MNSKKRAKQTIIVQAIFIGFLMFICLLGGLIKSVPAGDSNPKHNLENLDNIYSIKPDINNDTVKNQLNQVIQECFSDPNLPSFSDPEKLQKFIQAKYDEKFGNEDIKFDLKSIRQR